MGFADNRPMDYGMDRPTTPVAVTTYHDRVRWGPIFAGLVIAISTQLILSALGASIGLTNIAGSGAPRSNIGGVASAVGIWSIISLLISLFLGGWVTSRTSGPINKSTALLNGAVLWATTLAISAWLLSSGVSGAFGIVASNAGEFIDQAGVNVPSPNQVQQGAVRAPNITAQQTRDIASNAATGGWAFTIGSLIGLIASLIGSSVGVRPTRTLTGVQE